MARKRKQKQNQKNNNSNTVSYLEAVEVTETTQEKETRKPTQESELQSELQSSPLNKKEEKIKEETKETPKEKENKMEENIKKENHTENRNYTIEKENIKAQSPLSPQNQIERQTISEQLTESQRVINNHIVMNHTQNSNGQSNEQKKKVNQQQHEGDSKETISEGHQQEIEQPTWEQPAKKGKDGEQGRRGADGEERAAPGGDGMRGEDGYGGNHGEKGKKGQAAPHYTILVETVKGEREKVKVTINDESSIIYTTTDTITINAKGQDGQNGQDGGQGGHGGKGGTGGTGGVITEKDTDTGKAIQNGFHGGDGGHGGNGGQGGNGGNGGAGGNGGKVTIQVDDSKYFMMFDIHVEGGKPGKGGKEGEGGLPGQGGDPGKSGSGNKLGMKGKPGMKGKIGSQGLDGRPGVDGNITYKNTTTNETSSNLFNVTIDDFDVIGAADDDGILEPGESILITNFKLSNTGNMELPNDCILKIQSNKNVEVVGSIKIPKIGPIQQITLDHQIKGCITSNLRIEDLPKLTHLDAYCTLLEKKFNSSTKSMPITIQYPIRIHQLINPPTVAIGSQQQFTIEIQNISNKNYGGEDSKIAYEIHSDVNQQQSIRGELDMIQSFSTKSIPIQFQIRPSLNSFSNGSWTVEIYFKNDKIQRESNTVRLCHKFDPDQETDCLLISDSLFTEAEFKEYQHIFNKLGLKCGIYDCELESSYQKKETWNIFSIGKPVICSISSQASFSKLNLEHVIAHFSQKEDDSLQESGLVLVGGDVKSDILKTIYSFASSTEQIPSSQLTDWFITSNPTRHDFEKKLDSIQKSYAKKNQMYQYKIVEQSFAPVSLGMTKYQYGTAIALQSPLKNTSSFYIISDFDKTQPFFKNFLSREHASEKEESYMETETPQFEVLTSIIFSLSILKRLKVVASLSERTVDEQIVFVFKQKRYSLKHLFAVSLFYDFKHEFYIENSKMNKMMTVIQYLKSQLDQYDHSKLVCKDVFFVLWYAIARLNNTSWARSLINSSVSKNKPYVEKALQSLNDVFINCGFDLESEKRSAEKLAATSSRVTFVDIFKRTERLYPFPFN